MDIKSLIAKFKSSSEEKYVTYQVDPNEGIDFIFNSTAVSEPENLAIKSPLFGMQLTQLRGLFEQGLAEKNANGYTVLSENVVEQEDYFFDLFDLPRTFNGNYIADIRGNTSQAAFTLSLKLILSDGYELSNYSLNGPFLKVSETEIFRLTPAEFKALNAVQQHNDLSPRDRGEYENNWLIFQLQLAKKAGVNIDLGAFNKVEIVRPESVGLALEETPEGDLLLTPTYGKGIDVEDIKRRLGQFDSVSGHAIFRVKNRFVLLDEKRLEASHEILSNRRIPKDKVKQFLEAPSAYLDSALIDLDNGFSHRAHGAMRFSHRYFGDIEKSGVDWFSEIESIIFPFESVLTQIDSEESLAEIKQMVFDAEEKGAAVIVHEERQYDISDKEKVEQTFEKVSKQGFSRPIESTVSIESENKPELETAVVAIDANDENAEFEHVNDIQQLNISDQKFSLDNLKRNPFVHQDEGIKWLLAHYELAMQIQSQSGALLADDMGLGKTFMTLVSISEWYQRCKSRNETLKPTLIVAPLSLLENWQAEVEETFHTSPFSDIVVLQAGGDLKRFKISGAGRETQQKFGDDDVISNVDEIRYSLKIGPHYDDRLDKPGRLVLTTYQTLRDYQFSISRIQWGVAAFDEAQNIKNPNALSTIAAKALNADFRLLATGTPVENTLKDFWCLMDTAVPGLLGAWQEFRKTYIVPITEVDGELARQRKQEVGSQLRQVVGDYMLRRTKEANLKGLPQKKIYVGVEDNVSNYLPILAAQMKGEQLKVYDSIIDEVHQASQQDKRNVLLPSLLKMKLASIHHDLLSDSSFSVLTQQVSSRRDASSKIISMLKILRDIKSRDEKVLIFATSKRVQAFVSALVTNEFKVLVDIINGETKAVANKKSEATRKGIIDKFQSVSGFGVLIMSPIAAGVGLTVTGANNVIHIERHWNPAKEAQATDRAYRIGQTKDVNVYIPIALHPNKKSFDEHLNSLLGNKVDLSDAVVAPKIIDHNDLSSILSLGY